MSTNILLIQSPVVKKSGTGNAFISQKLTWHVSKTQSNVTKEKHVSFKEIQAVQIQSSFNSKFNQFKIQQLKVQLSLPDSTLLNDVSPSFLLWLWLRNCLRIEDFL